MKRATFIKTALAIGLSPWSLLKEVFKPKWVYDDYLATAFKPEAFKALLENEAKVGIENSAFIVEECHWGDASKGEDPDIRYIDKMEIVSVSPNRSPFYV